MATTSSRKRRRLDTDASSPPSDSQLLRSDIITLVCPIDESALTNNNIGPTGELTAHRKIVELSPVWKIALHCGLQEERNRQIVIKDFTIATVEMLLVTLYRREFGNGAAALTIPLEQAQTLLICAHKYGFDHTKRLAEDRLLGAIRADTDSARADIALLYRFARDYDAPRLVAKCTEHFNAILDKILPALELPASVIAVEGGRVSKHTHKSFSRTVEAAIPVFDIKGIFEFVLLLTDIGADEVLQRVPAAIAGQIEWLHRVLRASAISRRFISTPMEEKQKLKNMYRQYVLPVITALVSAEEEIPVARPVMRAILRDAVRSRRLVFLELVVSEIRIIDPDSDTESDSIVVLGSDSDVEPDAPLPQWVLDEKLLQEQISASSVQLYVEYRDVVDPLRATVAGNAAKDCVYVHYGVTVRQMRRCNAFSKEWQQKWSGVAVPHDCTSIVAGSSGLHALLTFLEKTDFARQDFNWDAIPNATIRGLAVGVECKPEMDVGVPGAVQSAAGVRLLLFDEYGFKPCRLDGDLSTEAIYDLLELAGYQLEDTANFPTSLKLVVMDLRAIIRAVDEDQVVPWLLGGFGVGDKYHRQRCTMEEFVEEVNQRRLESNSIS